MLEDDLPFIFESILNALLNSRSLISWFTKGDERCMQVTLRLDVQDNQPFMKFRRSPHSCIKGDANRAKDTKQSNPVLNGQKYVSDRESDSDFDIDQSMEKETSVSEPMSQIVHVQSNH